MSGAWVETVARHPSTRRMRATSRRRRVAIARALAGHVDPATGACSWAPTQLVDAVLWHDRRASCSTLAIVRHLHGLRRAGLATTITSRTPRGRTRVWVTLIRTTENQ